MTTFPDAILAALLNTRSYAQTTTEKRRASSFFLGDRAMFTSPRGAPRSKLLPFFRQLRIESIESPRLLASDVSPWHNPDNALDVTGDSLVTAGDIILVQNYLEAIGPGPVPVGAPVQPPYYDTDGDGFVTNLDKNLVEEYFTHPPCGAVQNPK